MSAADGGLREFGVRPLVQQSPSDTPHAPPPRGHGGCDPVAGRAVRRRPDGAANGDMMETRPIVSVNS